MPSLSQDEIAKYWDMFSQQGPGSNGLLSGEKMFALLKNSQLEDAKLEKIWDLADIDGDGNMDFEEFCIAMRLVFDILNGSMPSVPTDLPAWLVPASKQHLVTAKQALSGRPRLPSDSDDEGLSTNFNWYIGPADRQQYEQIYSSNTDRLGYVSYEGLQGLYSSLSIPATDISSAWNLVNPRSDEKIDKEQCLVFLHILHQRSNGVRIPRSVPASLRATFGKQKPSYDVSSSQAHIKPSHTGTAPTTGSGSIASFGFGNNSNSNDPGNEKHSESPEWEEVRLKRELQEAEATLADLEKKQASSDLPGGGSMSGMVRRELQLLLEYKEKQLREPPKDLRGARDEVQMIAEQVDALKGHLERRRQELAQMS